MPQRQLTPQMIDAWKADPYRCTDELCAVQLAHCLQRLWDLSHDDALLLLTDHKPALEAAAIQGHSILRTAYTVGWLDIESDRSIILASLGSHKGDDIG